MDIKCSVCGEPWDMDTIHEEIADKYPSEPWMVDGKHDQDKYEVYYDKVKADFFKNGCKAFGTTHNDNSIDKEQSEILSVFYAEFGDDLDGCASILDDMGML